MHGVADFLCSFGVNVGVCVEGIEDAFGRVVLSDDVVASSCEAFGELAIFADLLPSLAGLRQRGVSAEQDGARCVFGAGCCGFGRLVLLRRGCWGFLEFLGLRRGLRRSCLWFLGLGRSYLGLRLELGLGGEGDGVGVGCCFLELWEEGCSVISFFERFFEQAFQGFGFGLFFGGV